MKFSRKNKKISKEKKWKFWRKKIENYQERKITFHGKNEYFQRKKNENFQRKQNWKFPNEKIENYETKKLKFQSKKLKNTKEEKMKIFIEKN